MLTILIPRGTAAPGMSLNISPRHITRCFGKVSCLQSEQVDHPDLRLPHEAQSAGRRPRATSDDCASKSVRPECYRARAAVAARAARLSNSSSRGVGEVPEVRRRLPLIGWHQEAVAAAVIDRISNSNMGVVLRADRLGPPDRPFI